MFASADFVGNPAVPKGTRNKVAQVLRPSDPARLRAELQDLGNLLTNRKLVQERIVGQPGDRIRIVGGSMAGLEGKIISLKPNRFAVVIEVSLIAGRIVVEIDEGLLTRDLL